MKSKLVIKVRLARPRKDQSVRFLSGSGPHCKSKNLNRFECKVALKKGQEVFQSLLISVNFEKPIG